MPEILAPAAEPALPPQDTLIDRRVFLARLAAVTATVSAAALVRPRPVTAS